METHSITAVFDRMTEAESAVGRLEIAGIPAGDITVHGPDPVAAGNARMDQTIVTASVETRLIEKATEILSGEGRVDSQLAGQ
jgi:hypothetical protein